MRRQRAVGLLAGAFLTAGAIVVAQSPLAVDSGLVTIAGSSNIHEWTASTTKVRVTRARIAPLAPGANIWDNALKPGAIEAFEIAIPAATLASPKGDLDKNMLKALKVAEFPEITFKLVRFETKADAAGGTRAIGTLKIAGVEKEVALLITTKRVGATLSVHGSVDILMTDYGIPAPKAMMGMLKTDPKVTVRFETVLGIPLT